METTKKDLKILVNRFLKASNRVLSAQFEIYSSELKKFISFLDSEPLIMDYINSCGEPEFDVKKEVEEVRTNIGLFDLGSNSKKEVANIYAVIKYLANNNFSGYSYVFWGYSHSKKYQDKVDAFGDKYIRFLINHIEEYLTTYIIENDFDSSSSLNLNISGSSFNNAQVNFASDSASVIATQNNSDYNELDKLIKELELTIDSLNKEDKVLVNECIETIESVKEDKPKKGIIKIALKTLQGIAGTTEFLAAVTSLVQFVQTLI